jgi:glycogen synthase
MGDREPAALRILRLCSVFMPPGASMSGRAAGFDPVGGMQNHTFELTKALDARGVVQTVVTTRPPSAPRLERVGRRAEVHRLGLPIRRFRQLYSLSASRLIPRLAKDADLIHVHLGEDLAVLPLGTWASRRRNLPLVVTIHCSLRHTLRMSDPRTALLKMVGGRIELVGARSAEALIVLTERLARLFQNDGVQRDRVHVIPTGVDPELFHGGSTDPLPEVPRPRATFVGRLVAAKGVNVLLEAVRHLPPNLHVVFVGDGPLRARLRQRADRMGLGHRIHLIGFVPHDAVPALLEHSQVVVLPSLYEELGSVLLEAMQARVPIVASRVGGIPTIVRHGLNGLLVPPNDPRALADALTQVVTDPALSGRLSSGGELMGHGHDWGSMAETIHDVYQAAVGSGAGPTLETIALPLRPSESSR